VAIEISDSVLHKMRVKHGGITKEDVVECFANRDSSRLMLVDQREDNQTDPQTLWFISETNNGRRLKVVFIQFIQEKKIQIKTCYEANATEIRIYEKYSKK